MHIRSVIPIFFLALLISSVFAIAVAEREVTQEQLNSILSNTNNRAIIDLKFENDYVFENVDLSVITNNTPRNQTFKYIDDFIKYDMRTTGEESSPLIYYYYFTNLLPRKEIVSIDLYYYNKREINSNIKLKPYLLSSSSPYRLNKTNYSLLKYPQNKLLEYENKKDFGYNLFSYKVSPIEYNGRQNKLYLYDLKFVINLGDPLTEALERGRERLVLPNIIPVSDDNLKIEVFPSVDQLLQEDYLINDNRQNNQNQTSPTFTQASESASSDSFQVMYCNYIESNPVCQESLLDSDSGVSFQDHPVGLSLLDLSYTNNVNLKIINKPFLNNQKYLEIDKGYRLYNPKKINYFIYYQDHPLSNQEHEKLKSDFSLNLVSEKKYKKSLRNYSNNQDYCFGEFLSTGASNLEEINTSCFSNKSKGYFYVFLFAFPIEKRTFLGLFNSWHLNYFLNSNNQFISTDNYFQENNNFIKHKMFAIDQELGGINSSCVNDLCFSDFSIFSILEENNLLDLIESNTYTKQNITDILYNTNISATPLNGSKTFIINKERLTNQISQIKFESDQNFTENTVFIIIDSEKQRDIDLFDVSLLETSFYSPHNIPTVSDQTLENNYFAFRLLSEQENIFLNIENNKKNLSIIITNPVEKKFTSFNLLLLDQDERLKYNLYLTNTNIAKHYCNDCQFYIYGVPNFKYLTEKKNIFDHSPIPCLDSKGQKVDGYTGKDSYSFFKLSPFLYTWDYEKITNRTCDYGIYFCDADQLKTAFSKKIDVIKNNEYIDLGGVFFESNNNIITSFDNFVYNDEFSVLFLQNSSNEFDYELLTLDDYLNRSEEVLKYDFYLPPEYFDYSIFNIDVRYMSDSDFQQIFATHIKNYNKLNDSSVYQFRVSDYVNNYVSFKFAVLSANNKPLYENYLYNFSNFYDLNNNYLNEKIFYGNGLNSFIVVTNKDLTTQDTKNIFSEIRFLDSKYSFVSDISLDVNSNIYVFSFNDINFTTNTINYTFKNLSQAFEKSKLNSLKNTFLSNGLNAKTNNFGNLVPGGFNPNNKYIELNDYSFNVLNDGYLLKIASDRVIFSNLYPIVVFSDQSTDYRIDQLTRELKAHPFINSWLVKTKRDFLKVKQLNSDSENIFSLILDPQDVLARLVLFDFINSSNSSINLSSQKRLSFTNDGVDSKIVSGQYVYEFPKSNISRSNTNLENIFYGVKTNKICFNIDENNNLLFWNNLSNQDDLILSEALSIIADISSVPENTPISYNAQDMFFVRPIPREQEKKEMLTELFVLQNAILLNRFYSLDIRQTNYSELISLKSKMLADFENLSDDDFTALKRLSNNYFSNDYNLSLSDYNKNTIIITDSSDLFSIPGTIIVLKYKNSNISIPLLSVGNINNDSYVAYVKNNSLVFETLDKAINKSLLFENKLNNKLEKPAYFFVHFSRAKVSDLIIKKDLVNKNNKNKSISDMLDYLIFNKS